MTAEQELKIIYQITLENIWIQILMSRKDHRTRWQRVATQQSNNRIPVPLDSKVIRQMSKRVTTVMILCYQQQT